MSRPVTTFVESKTPCWPRVVHIAVALAPAQATKSRSGCRALTLVANGVRSVAADGTSTELTVGALGAEDRRDGRDVGLAEGAVLREDGDLLALDVAQHAPGRRDVLVGLASRPEGVAVGTRDGVGGGRTRDEEDLVVLRQRRHLQRHAARGRAGDDRVALTDEVGGRGDGLGRVAGVVLLGDLDGATGNGTGALRRVVDAGREALAVLLAVAGQRPGLRVDEAHLVRGAGTAGGAGRAVVARRCPRLAGRPAGRDGQRDHDARERETPPLGHRCPPPLAGARAFAATRFVDAQPFRRK